MEAIIYGLKLTIIGIGVVFFALSLVACFLYLFDKVSFKKAVKQPPVANSVTAATAIPVFVTEAAISPEALAVITAAVAMALDNKGHITRIRYRQPGGSAWQTHGRVMVMGSHVIKPPHQ